jgi:crotonobetainyl-CoA:carnitine CoA-transferase CaiB-like acyl-CoA transferase
MREMIYNFGVDLLILLKSILLSQFKHIKVLELASVLAGPGVGQFFAELGAQVVKVENFKTGGDVTRTWKSTGEQTDERSAYFCSVNWGKQSIGLDLTKPEGLDIVQKLALVSDIIIASYKPGDAEKLGVDYKTLTKNLPGLIYGQITGYGAHNPRVGYDAIIQAESGFMFMNGEPGGPSLKIPVALMDILAAHHLKEGLLLAMLEKAVTGNGRLVEVSLIQAAVSSLANQGSNYLVVNTLPQKQGSSHPNIAPYGDVFHTADGKEIILAIGTLHQFTRLTKILKIDHLLNDLRFETNALRVKNRTILNELLEKAIITWHSNELLTALRVNQVPAGQVRNMQEVFDEPEVRELLISSPNLQGLRTFVANPLPEFPPDFPPPPRLGQDTRDILKVLNFSPTAIQHLFDQNIVG